MSWTRWHPKWKTFWSASGDTTTPWPPSDADYDKTWSRDSEVRIPRVAPDRQRLPESPKTGRPTTNNSHIPYYGQKYAPSYPLRPFPVERPPEAERKEPVPEWHESDRESHPTESPSTKPRKLGISLVVIVVVIIATLALAAVAIALAVTLSKDAPYNVRYNLILALDESYRTEYISRDSLQFKSKQRDICSSLGAGFDTAMIDCTMNVINEDAGKIVVDMDLILDVNKLDSLLRAQGVVVEETNIRRHIWDAVIVMASGKAGSLKGAEVLYLETDNDREPLQLSYGATVRATGDKYIQGYGDKTSADFRAYSESYCQRVKTSFGNTYYGCEVLELSDGSVIIRSQIILRRRKLYDLFLQEKRTPTFTSLLEHISDVIRETAGQTLVVLIVDEATAWIVPLRARHRLTTAAVPDATAATMTTQGSPLSSSTVLQSGGEPTSGNAMHTPDATTGPGLPSMTSSAPIVGPSDDNITMTTTAPAGTGSSTASPAPPVGISSSDDMMSYASPGSGTSGDLPDGSSSGALTMPWTGPEAGTPGSGVETTAVGNDVVTGSVAVNTAMPVITTTVIPTGAEVSPAATTINATPQSSTIDDLQNDVSSTLPDGSLDTTDAGITMPWTGPDAGTPGSGMGTTAGGNDVVTGSVAVNTSMPVLPTESGATVPATTNATLESTNMSSAAVTTSAEYGVDGNGTTSTGAGGQTTTTGTTLQTTS